MHEDNTERTRETSTVLPIYHIGDEITFKYEGNIRATVEGSEVIDGKTWIFARSCMEFKVPSTLVVEIKCGE